MRTRVSVVVAALLLVVVAARGSSPVVFRPPEPDPSPQQTNTAGPTLQEAPADTVGSGVPFLILLVVLIGFVVFGLIGMALAVSFTRRRMRGERGVEIAAHEPSEPPLFHHHAEQALHELRKNRPPKDAVIAAWLRLEEARPREPHLTPTEFTQALPADAAVLRTLYQRARFSRETITQEHAHAAERELERIIRELT